MIPRFIGKVSGGKLHLNDIDKYQSWINSLEGKAVEVSVAKETTSRTEKQNKYLWGVVYTVISDYLGYTNDEVHELMKSILLKKHMEAGNKRYTVIRSTTDLSTDEFSKYIEDVKRWASKEFGLYVPESNQVNY